MTGKNRVKITDMKCEFCQEMRRVPDSRFLATYAGLATSRIVARADGLIAVPTIGQLFPGSLLALPTYHEETCARLEAPLRERLSGLVQEMMEATLKFGDPIFFEHGATSRTGGSCGIYHAHIHIVPLPERVMLEDLFPEHTQSAPSLLDAFCALRNSEHYLLIGSRKGGVAFAPVEQLPFRPASQHFRRKLCERFGLRKPWDWRETVGPEPEVLATIAAFDGANASDRTRHQA